MSLLARSRLSSHPFFLRETIPASSCCDFTNSPFPQEQAFSCACPFPFYPLFPPPVRLTGRPAGLFLVEAGRFFSLILFPPPPPFSPCCFLLKKKRKTCEGLTQLAASQGACEYSGSAAHCRGGSGCSLVNVTCGCHSPWRG